MMIIGIDFDNIINNLNEKTLELYNAHSGKSIQMSDITTYNFYDCLPSEDAEGIVKLFKNKTLWDVLTPIAGARDGLQKLIDKGHKVYLVTASSPESFMWKMSWLKKYFAFFNTDNCVRMMDKSLFKCDILIEDCLEQLIKHKSCQRVCLDYPWNRNENKDLVYDIRRANSWDDILNIINQIETEKAQWDKK